MAGVPDPAGRAAGARRRAHLGDAPSPLGAPLLEPVAHPRGDAALVADPSAPAVRAVPDRARQPDRRDGAPGEHRGASRPARPRSSSRSTSRAACAPPTSHRAGSSRPRPPRRRSSSGRASTTQIGIVAFAGFAEIVQAPTNDQEVLLDVIQSLQTGRRTAIGSAILQAIDAIAEVDPSVAKSQDGSDPTAVAPPAVPKGAYAPAIIVLLTDGASNAGPEPLDAPPRRRRAASASTRSGSGPRTRARRPRPAGRSSSDASPATTARRSAVAAGRAGGQGGQFRRAIDEDTLRAVADATGGEYYPAESADELEKVFAALPTDLITKHEVTEISVAFVAIAVVLVAGALLLGQAWRPSPRAAAQGRIGARRHRPRKPRPGRPPAPPSETPARPAASPRHRRPHASPPTRSPIHAADDDHLHPPDRPDPLGSASACSSGCWSPSRPVRPSRHGTRWPPRTSRPSTPSASAAPAGS